MSNFNRKTIRKTIHCAIIGFGARGLGFFERISAYARRHLHDIEINLTIYDPNEHGSGAHCPRQADYQLVNTVASQITMFFDKTCEIQGPSTSGPAFIDWANASGMRKIGSAFYHLEAGSITGDPIDENDYLLRSALGNYLRFIVDELTASKPHNINLNIIRSRVVNIKPISNDQYRVITEGEYEQIFDFLFLTLGHGVNKSTENEQLKENFVASKKHQNPNLAFIRSPYPLSVIESISPDARLLMQGMGLTAHDVIAELTIGRGGRYREHGDRLEYLPSGREPTISLFSRQGIPFSARAINEKGPSGTYKAKFFTLEYFKTLRQKKEQFDFFKDVLPILKKEMLHAYLNPSEDDTHVNYDDMSRIDEIFYPLQGKNFSTIGEYQRFIYAFIEQDIQHAYAGNISDPIKAASDVLRDVRDTMRYCVDWGGLTPNSHANFVHAFIPIMNRIAVGPPLIRNRQLLALIDAGLVQITLGPSPLLEIDESNAVFRASSTFTEQKLTQIADVVIQARIDPFNINLDNSALIGNLHKTGFISEYRNGRFRTGGINIDRNYNIINAKKQVMKNIWAVGNPVEGACFFTFVLPRPGVNSRFLLDADRCVHQMFKKIELDYAADLSTEPLRT